MATLLIRQLDEETKSRLRIRAARKGHSMEAEAREILRQSLAAEGEPREHIVDTIRRRMKAVGGVDLPEIPREPMREPPDFGE